MEWPIREVLKSMVRNGDQGLVVRFKSEWKAKAEIVRWDQLLKQYLEPVPNEAADFTSTREDWYLPDFGQFSEATWTRASRRLVRVFYIQELSVLTFSEDESGEITGAHVVYAPVFLPHFAVEDYERLRRMIEHPEQEENAVSCTERPLGPKPVTWTYEQCVAAQAKRRRMIPQQKSPLAPREVFPCETCKEVFTTAANRDRHQVEHDQQSYFVCSVCGKIFPRSDSKKRHEREVHQGMKRGG